MSKIFYHKDIPLLPAMLLVLSIQFLGYGFAGIFTKLLVDSPYMWWPSTLVDVSFYRALHEPEKRAKGKLSRYQFFIIVIVAIFTYSIVPVYLFPSITALSFVCWIWKDFDNCAANRFWIQWIRHRLFCVGLDDHVILPGQSSGSSCICGGQHDGRIHSYSLCSSIIILLE
ncbi:unnamed protein product [Musa acuminata var. zebrina]